MPSFSEVFEGTDYRDKELKDKWKINKNNLEVYVVGENGEALSFGKMKDLEAKPL
jgi:hypothetical protein